MTAVYGLRVVTARTLMYGAWDVDIVARDPVDQRPVLCEVKHRRLMKVKLSCDALHAVINVAIVVEKCVRQDGVRPNYRRVAGAILSGLSRMDFDLRAVLLVGPLSTPSDVENRLAFWNVFKAALAETRRRRLARGQSRCG